MGGALLSTGPSERECNTRHPLIADPASTSMYFIEIAEMSGFFFIPAPDNLPVLQRATR